MLKVLLIFFVLIPISIFSQSWKFNNSGNAFDGFKKIAFTENTSNDNTIASLGIVNYSNKRVIKWGDLGDNGIDNLNLILILKEQIAPERILISFDNENFYYELNFSSSDDELFILNAYSDDFKKFLSFLDIISNLKTKKMLHIRAIEGESKLDFNFSLKGSSDAINKTFICPDYKKNWNWTDAFFEYAYFASLFTQIDNGTKNLVTFGIKCQNYFDKEYGPYFFTQIKSIESASNAKFPTLIFKNYQGVKVAEIESEIYLKE
jgi:regulatory protein YycH of two-component signal transduction system YycFG